MDDLTTPPGGHPQPFDLPPMPAPHEPAPSARPLYLPNLIAAIIASVGVVIGSLGPWLTFLAFERANTDGDGKITLTAGLVSAAALFVVFTLGRSGTQIARMRKLGRVSVAAGVLAFVIGAFDAREVLSRRVELFGASISPQIGWGLWLVLIGSLVLIVTATVVIKQIPKQERP
jgi:hypothetical protein